MQQPLHVIEPTCYDHTGHCYGYIEAVTNASANLDLKFDLWLDKRSQLTFSNNNVTIHPHFHYKWRKLQLYLLYRTLIKANANLFIPTAGELDLRLIGKLLKRHNYKGKIFAHFHQCKRKLKKLNRLRDFAKRYNDNVVILTTTPALGDLFKALAFSNVHVLPCPTVYTPTTNIANTHHVEPSLSYLGAARHDKGFDKVITLIDYLNQHPKWQPPVRLQISSPHSGKYDDATTKALQKLNTINYPHLTLLDNTLNQQDYQRQFDNTICLLLYDYQAYHDKFSGLCLDALLNGAPVITIKDTWMGDTVERFQAGIALSCLEPSKIYDALKTVHEDFLKFRDNAQQASEILAKEHHPRHTVEQIVKHLNSTYEE